MLNRETNDNFRRACGTEHGDKVTTTHELQSLPKNCFLVINTSNGRLTAKECLNTTQFDIFRNIDGQQLVHLHSFRSAP